MIKRLTACVATVIIPYNTYTWYMEFYIVYFWYVENCVKVRY